MPSKKISGMTTGVLADGDYIPFVDISETNTRNQNKKVTCFSVRKYFGIFHGSASVSAGNYTCNITGLNFSVLQNNGYLFLQFDGLNGASPTLSVGGTAKSIVDRKGNALKANVITANSFHLLVYDSVNDRFVIQTVETGTSEIHLAPTYATNYTCELKSNELTNIKEYVLAFDSTTEEYAYFSFRVPANWDASTIDMKFQWSNGAGATAAETVVIGVSAASVSNDDTRDPAFGTEVTVTDTLIATSDFHETSYTGTITPSGTAAAGDMVYFKIARKTANASDTMAGDLHIKGMTLKLGYTDIWV